MDANNNLINAAMFSALRCSQHCDVVCVAMFSTLHDGGWVEEISRTNMTWVKESFLSVLCGIDQLGDDKGMLTVGVTHGEHPVNCDMFQNTGLALLIFLACLCRADSAPG